MNRRTFLHTATLASLAAQIQSLRAATAGMKIKIGACVVVLATWRLVALGSDDKRNGPVLGGLGGTDRLLEGCSARHGE